MNVHSIANEFELRAAQMRYFDLVLENAHQLCSGEVVDYREIDALREAIDAYHRRRAAREEPE